MADAIMDTFESRAARRRAELEWQELARRGEAEKAAVREAESRAKKSARLLVDEKTMRLRSLRLAREQAEEAPKKPTVIRRRRARV